MANWNLKMCRFKKHRDTEENSGGATIDLSGNDRWLSQRLPQICAAMAFGIALLAWAGWLTDIRLLAGQWGDYIPMAPITALAFLLLGGALFSVAHWPAQLASRCLAIIAVSLIMAMGLLSLLRFTSGIDLGLEHALGHTDEHVGQIPLGYMSPLTAAAFLLEGAALILLLMGRSLRHASSVAALLAVIAIAFNLVVLTGYAYGVPLLYGGTIIPVALPTALAFVLLGIGQIKLLIPRVTALLIWTGDSLRSRLLRAFLPSVLLLILVGGWMDVMVERVWSLNPALWHSLMALVACGLFVFITGCVARRTGDAIEDAHAQILSLSRFPDENPDPVMRFSRDGRLLYANRNSQPLLQYWQCEQLGQSLPQAEQCQIAEALDQDGSQSREITCGTTIYSLLLAPVCLMDYVNIYAHDITQRKRMEEQVRADEAILSNAIALAQLAPWEYDVAAGVFVFNQHFYTMCATSVQREGGYVKTAQDFCKDLIPPEDIGMVSAELAQAIADSHHDYSRQFEYRILRRDGQIRHVVACFKAAKDPAGRTVKLYGTTQDITQRKLAETAIRESQQSLSNIMQFYPEATMVIDAAGRLITWNRAMEKLTGVDASQMLGKGDHEYALPFYGIRRPILRDYFAQPGEASTHGYYGVKWQDDVLTAEVRVDRLRGGVAYLYVNATALRDLSGKVTGAIESVHDITARKIMEESLRASERQLSGAIELANLAYWTYKVKEDVFLFNNQFYASYGTTAEQEGGFCIPSEAYLSNLVHPQDTGMVAGEIKKALASDDPDYSSQFDHRVLGRDGMVRTMAVSFSITRDDSGHPVMFYGTSQDITSRKQAEQTLRSRTALLEAQMNATLDGILVVDEKQKRILTNQRIVELFDIPRSIQDDEDDAALLKHVVSLTRYPDRFLEKVMYLYDHPGETSRDEIEFRSGMVLDRYSSPVLGKDGKNYGRIWTFRDITARKQAEESLLRSEIKFRTLYDSTSDAVMMLDEKGFFDCNKATLMAFGCQTREEFCSKHPADVSPQVQPCGIDSLTLANQHIATAMEKGSHRFEWMHRRANTGEIFPAEVLLTPMELDGRPVLQATVRDITYRKQAEEEILRSREQLRLLLNSTGEGIYGVDASGICTFHNPACLRLLGYKETDKLLGENMHMLMHHTDIDGKYIDLANCRLIKAINKGEGAHADDEIFWRADGTSFPVEYWAYPQIHDGIFVGVVVTFVDITSRKLLEKQSRSDFAKIECQSIDLQAIFDAAPIGFLLVDERAQITRVNDVMAKMVGKEMAAMLGVQPGDGLCCIHALAAPAGCGTGKDCSDCPVRMNLTRVLQSGQTVRGLEVHYSMHIKDRDVLVWLSISMSPLTVNDAPHVLLAITNIIDQKQPQDALTHAGPASAGMN